MNWLLFSVIVVCAVSKTEAHTKTWHDAQLFWKAGYRGQGVRVAIFDSGVDPKHPYVGHAVKQFVDYTGEKTPDLEGHGTAVAGIIASTEPECPGIAPDAEIYMYKVYTRRDTFSILENGLQQGAEDAIRNRVHIAYLAFGQRNEVVSDYPPGGMECREYGLSDQRLAEVINLLQRANITVVMAANGAGFASPGLVTVGSTTARGRVAWFSPGNVDMVAHGVDVPTIGNRVRCRTFTGTSASAAVAVAGAALIKSTQLEHRDEMHDLSSILKGSAYVLTGETTARQGHGELDLEKAFDFLRNATSDVDEYLEMTPKSWRYVLDAKCPATSHSVYVF